MAFESTQLTREQRMYSATVTLPTMLVAIVGVLFGAFNVIEAGIDLTEGDWTGAGGNFAEAFLATFLSSAVGRSGAEANKAKMEM